MLTVTTSNALAEIWKLRVVFHAAVVRVISTVHHLFTQVLAASEVIDFESVPSMLMLAFVEFHCQAAVMLVTGTAVMLQMRAPIEYWLGPTVTLLLSRPMTFHSMGVIVSEFVAAWAGRAVPKGVTRDATTATTARKAPPRRHDDFSGRFNCVRVTVTSPSGLGCIRQVCLTGCRGAKMGRLRDVNK